MRPKFTFLFRAVLAAYLCLFFATSAGAQSGPSGARRRSPARLAATPQSQRTPAADKAFSEGRALARRGTADSLRAAIVKFVEAAGLYKEAGSGSREAAALSAQGSAHEKLGEYADALKAYERARSLQSAHNDKFEEGTTLRAMGRCYTYLGEYVPALESLKLSYDIRLDLGDPGGAAETQIGEAMAHAILGDKVEAVRLSNDALDTKALYYKRYKNPTIAHNIGLLYFYLSQTVNSRSEERRIAGEGEVSNFGSGVLLYMGKAFEDWSEQRDKRMMAESLTVIGDVLSDERYGEEARSLRTMRTLGPLANTGTAGLYARALSLWREVGDAGGETRTLLSLAALESKEGGAQRALELYRQASFLAASTGDRRSQAVALGEMMAIRASRRELSLAAFYGKQAVNIYQGLRTSVRALGEETRRRYLHTIEENYRRLADVLIAQGRLPEAEQVLSLLKREEYAGLLVRGDDDTSAIGNTPAEAGAADVLARLASISRERAELAARLDGGSIDAAARSRLRQIDRELLPRANAEFDSALERVRHEAPSSSQRTAEVRDAQALMDKLAAMGPGTVALYTIISTEEGRSSRGWVILLRPPESRKAYELDVSRLDPTVLELRAALGSASTDPRPAARRLYDIIFRTPQPKERGDTTLEEDLETFLKGRDERTLMWSLDGVLRYVPVAALSPDGEHYMVERYRNVVFTPASVPTLADPVAPDWRALGLGVSKEYKYFDELEQREKTFAALKGVPLELAAIVQEEGTQLGGVLPGVSRLNERFTYDAMLDELDRGFSVVHIASHFRYDSADPTKSFLLLGDGKRLPMSAFKNSKRIFSKTALVTLSACDTAMGGGARTDGEEVEGLGYVAQRLGAQSVIASLWPISDVGARLLMPEFYRRHKEDPSMPKAEALRLAQLSLLRGGLRAGAASDAQRDATPEASAGDPAARAFRASPERPFEHPYYWAPFILIGNWK